jgi:hypothetical protein
MRGAAPSSPEKVRTDTRFFDPRLRPRGLPDWPAGTRNYPVVCDSPSRIRQLACPEKIRHELTCSSAATNE